MHMIAWQAEKNKVVGIRWAHFASETSYEYLWPKLTTDRLTTTTTSVVAVTVAPMPAVYGVYVRTRTHPLSS